MHGVRARHSLLFYLLRALLGLAERNAYGFHGHGVHTRFADLGGTGWGRHRAAGVPVEVGRGWVQKVIHHVFGMCGRRSCVECVAVVPDACLGK